MRRPALLAALLLLLGAPAQALDKPRDWMPPPATQVPNFREAARQTIIELAAYAKKRNPSFVVLMRGGVELLVKGEREAQWEDVQDPNGRDFAKRLPLNAVQRPLVKVLDGLVLDGLYCGPYRFDKPIAQLAKTRKDLDGELAREKKQGIHRVPVPAPVGPFSNDPKEELRKAAEVRMQQMREERQRRTLYAVDAMQSEGRRLMSVEACATQAEVDGAYRNGERDRVDAFSAVGDDRLDQIPRARPRHENAQPAATITAARNWLPMLKSDRFGSRAEMVMALEDTNYDVVVVDVAHRGADALTKSDVYRLKFKKLGPPRLVLAVVPLGRAFDWRWYWQKGWQPGDPPYLFALDDEPGAFITDVASPEWRALLGKYLAGVMDLGFDGVMFDDVGTYLWFEELMPLGE
jgi:cysteinyl-tRNA synthetase, unknown class